MSVKSEHVEKILLNKYLINGVVTEDEIVDVCLDNDLDLIEIDRICDRILTQKVLIKQKEEIDNTTKEKAVKVDRSRTDYDSLFDEILSVYPGMAATIEYIKNIEPPRNREWRGLIEAAQNGNEYANNRLTEMYMRNVIKVAYSFSKQYYVDFEEAFQNGMIGLSYAIKKWDIHRTDSFVSYYFFWANNVMRRNCFPKYAIVSYPVHLKEEVLSQVSELIEAYGVEEYEKIISDYSIFQSYLGDHNLTNVRLLTYEDWFETSENTCDDENNLEELIELKELQSQIRGIFNELNDKEKLVISLRFGMDGFGARTLEQVGNSLDVTRERIRQIEKNALRKLYIKLLKNDIVDNSQMKGDFKYPFPKNNIGKTTYESQNLKKDNEINNVNETETEGEGLRGFSKSGFQNWLKEERFASNVIDTFIKVLEKEEAQTGISPFMQYHNVQKIEYIQSKIKQSRAKEQKVYRYLKKYYNSIQDKTKRIGSKQKTANSNQVIYDMPIKEERDYLSQHHKEEKNNNNTDQDTSEKSSNNIYQNVIKNDNEYDVIQKRKEKGSKEELIVKLRSRIANWLFFSKYCVGDFDFLSDLTEIDIYYKGEIRRCARIFNINPLTVDIQIRSSLISNIESIIRCYECEIVSEEWTKIYGIKEYDLENIIKAISLK